MTIKLISRKLKIKLTSRVLKILIRFGVMPADSILLYDDKCFSWHSGFGPLALVLYGLVRSTRPEVVVEIGSAYGLSTCFIAAALQRNNHGKLYSIDPHETTEWNDSGETTETFAIVQQRLKELKLSKFVEQIRLYSSKAIASWNTPIDILFIDGSHSYEDVKNDFFGFLPYVKHGGFVLFHDTTWEYHKDNPYYRSDIGVPRVVQELQEQDYPTVTIPEHFGLTILQNYLGGYKLIR